MSGGSQPGQAAQPSAQPTQTPLGGLSDLIGTLKNAQSAQPTMPQARYFQSTLEPMQMLQAYRSGQPVVNHVFAPQPQFLPNPLPAYTPQPAPSANPFAMLPVNYGVGQLGGYGGEGSDGGDSADGGSDGSDGGSDGGGGGGGGGGK